MNSFIDILSRLIIATITFVAPMIVFCFGVFFDALKLNKKEKEEKNEAYFSQALSQLSNDDADKAKIFKETLKKVEDTSFQKICNFLLHPKTQIILIFSFLFLSLSALMLSHLVLGNVWKFYSYAFWKFLIHISFWSYCISVLLIILFVRNVVIMKEKVETTKRI